MGLFDTYLEKQELTAKEKQQKKEKKMKRLESRETTRMTAKEIKAALTDPPKWIRELSPAKQQKYVLLLRRFTIDRTSGRKPDVYIDGWRIPTNVPRAVVEPLIKANKNISDIAERLQGHAYIKQIKEKRERNEISTVKILKKGEVEKPIIRNIEKVLHRSLSDKEKQLAILLSEKSTKGEGYNWNIPELQGLFQNDKIIHEIASIPNSMWDVTEFATPLEIKEMEEGDKITKEFTKNPRQTEHMASAIRKGDNKEIIDFLQSMNRKHKDLFRPMVKGEKTSEWFSEILAKIIAMVPERSPLNYICKYYLSELQLSGLPQREISSIEELSSYLDSAINVSFIRQSLKKLNKRGERESVIFQKLKKKAEREERTKVFRTRTQKIVEQTLKEDQERVTALIKQLIDFNKKLRISPQKETQPQKEWLREMLLELSKNSQFSKEARAAAAGLATGNVQFPKTSRPVMDLEDIAVIIAKTKGIKLASEKDGKITVK